MAKRERGKECLHLFSRTSKPKEPTNKKNNLAAFTLAEVLITLVIIGVVAALTIPSVVTSYKKHQTVTQLKKTYTALSQATNMAIKDHGPIQNWDQDTNAKDFVDKYLKPYLKVARDCGYGESSDCEFECAYLKTPNSPDSYSSDWYRLILNDGSALFVKFANSISVSGTVSTTIDIDVNGKKGPNVYGKDIFVYKHYIKGTGYEGKFAPNAVGLSRSSYITQQCSTQGTGKASGKGQGCAALIMLDGWQIKDDYPW